MITLGKDVVNNPEHYKGGSFECIENLELMFDPHELCAGYLMQAYQYIFRHEKKNGMEDLKKAKWFLDRCADMIAEMGWSPTGRIVLTKDLLYAKLDKAMNTVAK